MELTEEQLWNLDNIVENGVFYLIRRDAETTERVFRFRHPSQDQQEFASIERHKYNSLLGQDREIKSRSQLEKEYADELKQLRKDTAELGRKLKELRVEFIDREVPTLPDAETDPEAFKSEAEKRPTAVAIAEVEQELQALDRRRATILGDSREDLAAGRFVAIITALCWEKKAGDGWVPVWEGESFSDSWEAFRVDRTPLPSRLKVETRIAFASFDFFGRLPSLPDGGSGI